MTDDPAKSLTAVVLPVARLRALTRGLLCAVPAVLFGAASFGIYTHLDFTPTAISNRLVDYSIAFVALPCPLLALIGAFRALRWLLLAAWPAHVGILADENGLALRLGPFGTKAFNAARIDAAYPFEQIDDSEEGSFEAYLPEEEQFARLLPRMTHPDSREPLHRVILRVASGTEQDVAAALGPVIREWPSRAARDGVGRSAARRV